MQVGLLGAVVESSRHAVFVSTHERNLILAVNPAACELLGYTRAELLQLTPPDYTTRTEAELDAVYGSLDDAGATVRGEARLRRRDGSVVTIGYWGSWVHAAEGDYLLTITEPIDEPLRQREPYSA